MLWGLRRDAKPAALSRAVISGVSSPGLAATGRGEEDLQQAGVIRGLAARYWLLPALAACLVLCFIAARGTYPNSDSVQNYNELASLNAGRFLLPHWVLAPDNFYLTDLPFYALGLVLFGPALWLLYGVPFVVFALLLIASLLLVRHCTGGRANGQASLALLLYLLAMPFMPSLYMLLISDFHTASLMLCLFALLLAAPTLGGQRAHVGALWGYGALVFIACSGDPFAQIFFSAPMLALVALRFALYRRFSGGEWRLAGITLLAGGLALGFPALMASLGGFTTKVSFYEQPVAQFGLLLDNVRAFGAAVQVLFSATYFPLAHVFALPFLILTRKLVLLLVLALAAHGLWRGRASRDNAVVQFLILSAVCLTMADVFSEAFYSAITPGPVFPNAAVRYVTPAYVFLSVAAIIELQAFLSRPWPAWAMRGMLGVAVIGGGLYVVNAMAYLAPEVSAPPGIYQAPQYALAGWLRAQGFTYGMGDYYTSQLVRALSQGQVMADPVVDANGLQPFLMWTDTTRFALHVPPQFLVFQEGAWSARLQADVTAAFAPPLREPLRSLIGSGLF